MKSRSSESLLSTFFIRYVFTKIILVKLGIIFPTKGILFFILCQTLIRDMNYGVFFLNPSGETKSSSQCVFKTFKCMIVKLRKLTDRMKKKIIAIIYMYFTLVSIFRTIHLTVTLFSLFLEHRHFNFCTYY